MVNGFAVGNGDAAYGELRTDGEELGHAYDYVFTSDGSTDRTGAILEVKVGG